LAGRQPPLLDAFTAWLTAFGDAWEQADAERMADLFALGATMQPEPFAEPIRGRHLIGEHWQSELRGLTAVRFSAQVLGAGDTYGVAHFRVEFDAGEKVAARDGVLLTALDSRGRCTSLRAWWHQSAESWAR
jgi:hypothetical protein